MKKNYKKVNLSNKITCLAHLSFFKPVLLYPKTQSFILKLPLAMAVFAIFGFCCIFPKTAFAFLFTTNNTSFEVKQEELNSWKGAFKMPKYNMLQQKPEYSEALNFYTGLNFPESSTEYKIYNFKLDRIYSHLKFLASKVEQPKTEPVLEIVNGKAVKFHPPLNGIKLNKYESALTALEALQKNEQTAELVVDADEPKTSLSATNALGINELVGYGESSFKGSPKNRVHNIKVGLTKFKGSIVKPEEEFSFNKILGPVEAEQGFLPELVIKRTGTVPELGGGLCQVSSTVFRTAMNSGLPITQRKNHSFAVQYYAPQGTDATIYPGVIDLKFKNDTPAHILVWAYIKDNAALVFEFWGTKDSRVVTLEQPVQYDKKPNGSMKAYWTRIVEKDGKISTSTFNSTYLPPDLFKRQETYPATPSPAGL